MNLKKNKPFVLNNGEAGRITAKYSQRLIILTVLFSFAVPLIINGFLSYTYSYYVENNTALAVLDIFLYYFIGITSAAAQYFCYAVLVVSLYRFGIKPSIRLLLLQCSGVVFTCLIVNYIVSCLLGGYVLYDFSDFNSAEAFFYALFSAVLICVKNVITVVACRKMRFTLSKYCIYFFSISFAVDIAVNILNTALDILFGGAPEIAEHFIYLAQPYLESVFKNILGLFVMIYTARLLDSSYKKASNVQDSKEENNI